MPRRGRTASPSFGRRPAPSRNVPAPAPQHQPYAQPAQPAAMMTQPKQPGMLAQVATTAAGVAVGSAVGHTLGHAITGGFGGSSDAEAPPAQAPTYQQGASPMSSACQFELKQFIECAQNQHDLSLCEGFNEVLKQCKVANGLAM